MKEESRVAIVTGATRGIGRATAERLAMGGVHVALAARSGKALDEMADQFRRQGKPALAVPADVRRREDCDRLITTVVEEFGRLDFLINNAGVGVFATVAQIEDRELHEIIETNLYSVFYLCRAAIPVMRAQPAGGHIVNAASLAAKNTFAGGAAYCASKFGLMALTECLMLEERHNGIRVSAVQRLGPRGSAA